ncbi:putative sphingosine kinase [Aspergillus homomorphus CBS 101889]|uniref:Putative sphingosine kinase n=1 Tax=Aspergillus homomorphus (strain CBS 101889) TaxID=1450537 RepID=A0A395HJW7_ASPHC|nr:putative sphingosine kinase [Aspergillus homomorphus CBS 101889]RAL08232.1 putative sphingosine kinase [Aspergillus homomorphus CBS 101889]
MSSLGSPKTIKVDKSVSLSIEDAFLIIKGTLSNSLIDLYAILNAYISTDGLTITYVDGNCGSDANIDAVQYAVRDEKEREQAAAWAKHLLKCAHGQAQLYKRLKVIINPFCSGAVKKFRTCAAPIFAAAHCQVDVEETRYKGHAIEIAEKIDLAAYDAIVCCSGDGLPHEVFNGLAKRADALKALTTMAVAMVPCGSGNAMAWNLFGTDNVSLAALAIVKGVKMPLDLLSITQGERHTVSFLSQSLGVLADSDLKTEHLRWMGDHRFIYGVLTTIAQRTAYPCELAFKTVMGDKPQIRDYHQRRKDQPLSVSSEPRTELGGLPLKYGTVQDDLPEDWEVVSGEGLSSFYASNMAIVAKDTNFFPAALPNDGLLDVMTVDDTIGFVGALEATIKLPQGKCFELGDVQMRKVTAYRLTPKEKEGCISVDGEWYPFEAFQVEVHQGLGRVLSRSHHAYQV